MSLTKPKIGNKTIMLVSGLILLLYLFLAAGRFGIISSGWALTTANGTAILTLLGAGILLLETYFEGTKPNLKKDTWALVSTFFAIVMIVASIIIWIGQPAITGGWSTTLGIAYLITWVLLAQELIWD